MKKMSAHDHRSENWARTKHGLKFIRFPTIQKGKFKRDLSNSSKEEALF